MYKNKKENNTLNTKQTRAGSNLRRQTNEKDTKKVQVKTKC